MCLPLGGWDGLLALWRKPRASLGCHAAKEGCVLDGIVELIMLDQVGECACSIRMPELATASGDDRAVCSSEVALIPAPKVVKDAHR